MPRHTDIARRLAKMIENPRFKSKAIDWSQCPPELRAAEANRATTLIEVVNLPRDDRVILEAFEALHLDAQNPWSWRVLLYYFADAHFGRRKTGRSRWNEENLIELLQDFGTDAGRVLSDAKRLEQLQEEFPDRYGHVTPGQLHKKLTEARRRFALP